MLRPTSRMLRPTMPILRTTVYLFSFLSPTTVPKGILYMQTYTTEFISFILLIPRVQTILKKRKKRHEDMTFSERLGHSIHTLTQTSSVVRQNIFIPLFFLVVYYIIQGGFQLDIFCPYPSDDGDHGENSSEEVFDEGPKESEMDEVIQCQTRLKTRIEEWKGRDNTVVRVVTFLLGFYVSNIVSTWWAMVSLFPTTCALGAEYT